MRSRAIGRRCASVLVSGVGLPPSCLGFFGRAAAKGSKDYPALSSSACCGRLGLFQARDMGRRRGESDPLETARSARWLVVRDRYSHPLEHRLLKPGADLRAILNAERDARIKAGWNSDPIGRRCGFFFCDRENERLCVAIEWFEPGSRSSTKWSYLG